VTDGLAAGLKAAHVAVQRELAHAPVHPADQLVTNAGVGDDQTAAVTGAEGKDPSVEQFGRERDG
jgi:hypothetical protein